jgi:hypothetical protein
VSEGEKRQDLGVAKGFRTISPVIRARKTRQLVIFPLATPTVGWVLDRTPGGPKRQCRTRSESGEAHPEGRNVCAGLGAKAESCAGGLPTEDAAKGKTHAWIPPDNEFVGIDKEGFQLCQESFARHRSDTFFTSAVDLTERFFLSDCLLLPDGISMQVILKSSAHGPHSLMKCVCTFRFALAATGRYARLKR